jgi:4-hydroxymandelate oxidase
MAERDLSALISVADFELAAREAMAPAALAYAEGGAGDEITLNDNAAAWRRLAIRPRALVGVGQRDPSVSVLGARRPHPLLIAPMAFQRMAHPDGEIAMARAAEATGAVMCLSTLGTATPAVVATAVPGAPRWFQLYVFSDRGVSRDLVAQAVEHGYEALVVTVDLPVLGFRERERRTALHSADAHAVAAAAAAGATGAMSPADFAELVDPELGWHDIEQFAAESPLPVVLKGLLTPEDARLACECGASAIVVSNHGGRQLDTVLSGADALAPMLDEVEGRIEVLVDGGIRRGTDVFKALALGAAAVMVGRPALWGLGVGGDAGVRRVLEILLDEFDLALALAGAPEAARLERRFVCRGPWAGENQ